jgi:hypothetical protein
LSAIKKEKIMAAKKKLPAGGYVKPSSPVEQAAAAIQRRYGSNVAGAKTMREAIQGLKDVVAESSLVDKYSMRTLDAAATRVAQKAFTGMTQAQRKNKGRI